MPRQIVNKLTHISGSLINHVYIKNTLIKEFFTTVSVEKTYFSVHDVVRTVIDKNADNTYTIP